MLRTDRLRARFSALLALSLLAGAALAAPGAGSGAADFLDLPTGARSGALGGATGSLPGDLASLFRNPALLSSDDGTRLHFSHQNWFQGIEHETGVFAFRAPGGGRAALHLRYLHQAPIPIFDGDLQEIGSLQLSDIAAGFSYARRFARRLDLGVSLHQVRQNLGDATGSGWTGDLGAGFLARGYYWSGALRSLGDGIRWSDDPGNPTPISREMSFGAARYFPGVGAILTVEYRRPELWSSTLHGGVEYMLSHHLALRSGYTRSIEAGDEASSLMSFGAGVQLAQLGFDYSYRSYEYLGEVHAVSIRLIGLAGQITPYSLFRAGRR